MGAGFADPCLIEAEAWIFVLTVSKKKNFYLKLSAVILHVLYKSAKKAVWFSSA